MQRPVWRIELLGGLQATSELATITRFRTRRVALLLAHLAYYRDRSHSREELAYLLWPDEDEEVSRRNLRQALSSLRRHLEPPPLPPGSVLLVNQSAIRLNPEIVTTDVADFERLLVRAGRAESDAEQIECLDAAVAIYRGAMLPGQYEDWVLTERQRLENSHVQALKSLAWLCDRDGRISESISHTLLALGKEPLDEELHTLLIRLYLESGRPAHALK